MKLTFTNWFNKPNEQKNKEDLEPSDTIDVQDCTITNYESDTGANQKGALKVVVNGQQTTINGKSCFDVERIVELNETKHNIFKRLALQDGNTSNLTEEDLKKADDLFKEGCTLWKLGVVDITYSAETHIAVVKIKDNQILKFNFNNMSEITLSKYELSDSEEEIFDLYNTDKSFWNRKILNENELTQMLEEIIPHCTEEDGRINPKKIRQFIESKGFKSVNVCDIKGILDKVSAKGKALSIYNSSEKRLDGVTSDNIGMIISEYSNIDRGFLRDIFLSDPSLIKDICSSNDQEQIDKLKNLIIERAERFMPEEEMNNFKIQINDNISNKNLANIITKFISESSYKEKEKLYENNKNCILNMMAGKDLNGNNLCNNLCKDDLNAMANKIIALANKYNPKKMVESYLKSDNKEVKKLAQELLDSDLLDFWPTYVAAIISQETGFRETGDIFSVAGQGVMQLTLNIVKQMYKEPESFDKELISELRKKYPDPETLYNEGVKNKKNVQLQYELGMVAIRYKLKETLRFIEEGKMETKIPSSYDGTKAIIDNSTKLLEATAMWYNSNTNLTQKKDAIYGTKTIIRADYCRNVITRFKQYLPKEIKTGSYYEWNPITNQYVVKN